MEEVEDVVVDFLWQYDSEIALLDLLRLQVIELV